VPRWWFRWSALGAGAVQQGKWTDAYTKALSNATVKDGNVTVAAGEYGPLPAMMSSLLGIAQTGGLDGLLMVNGRFYQTDYTPALLFMGDGTYLSGQAQELGRREACKASRGYRTIDRPISAHLRARAGDPARPDHYNICTSPLLAAATLAFIEEQPS
jgi:hypothetical protein